MPGKMPCAGCGQPIYRTATSLPEGRATCRSCRAAARQQEHPCRECGAMISAGLRKTRCGPCRYRRAQARAVELGRTCETCGKPAVAKGLCMTHYTRMIDLRPGGRQTPGHTSEWVSRKTREALHERDDWTCQICGEPVARRFAWTPDSPTLDHIVPRSLGGGHDPGNLRTACWSCNTRRGNRVEADASGAAE